VDGKPSDEDSSTPATAKQMGAANEAVPAALSLHEQQRMVVADEEAQVALSPVGAAGVEAGVATGCSSAWTACSERAARCRASAAAIHVVLVSCLVGLSLVRTR
jgi:hypothetical protein